MGTINSITAPITVVSNSITAPITVVSNIITAPITVVSNTITAPVVGAADAYQLALRDGFVGTRAQWLESLDGRSAYQSYLATTAVVPPLSEMAWAAAGGQQGEKGDKGDAGVAGPLSPGYTHTQLAAASLWSINHALARHPSVTVTDSAGSVVIGQVQYLSVNQLAITFSAAFAGTAYLN